VDSNHAEIVAALRRCDVSVLSLAALGRGVPDLLCSWRGRVTLLEVKRPGETLNSAQVRWHADWDPFANVCVVQSITEAVDAVCR
jgi:hypothetical protein